MKEKPFSTSSVDFAKALADETRQKIMNLCCCQSMTVTEIVEALGDVSQPTVSHHLAILRDAGLVRMRNEGKHTFYTLNQEQLAVCCGRLIVGFAPETDAAVIVKDSFDI
jgi:ArsR family transcriptional regulator, arsenate/arsenite/antimonite-responsive transcriptional repressor